MGLGRLSDEALADRARGGDEYARVIGAALRGPMFGFGVTFEDAYQEALIGLWRACRAHRPDRGRFATYAATCIRNKVRNARVRAQCPRHRVLSEAVGLDRATGEGGRPLADVLVAGAQRDLAVIVELREELARVARRRPTPRRSYSEGDVGKALELVREEGKSYSVAAVAVGANPSTVARWVREAA
jgi:RNA polymerase sigma factor (sigma-70 family)